MIKKAGYLVFAFFFYIGRLFPLQEKKCFLVATHDDSPEGNVGIAARALAERDSGYRMVWLTRRDTISRPLHFFVVNAWHLATAGTVLMDNVFLPTAYTRFSVRAKVVQLWHGTGTIKKFGQDVNVGSLKKLEYRANQRITHLIVNSETVKKEYASAFGIPGERIYVLGLPRTDLFLQEDYLEQRRQEFWCRYPKLRNKKCILYAPTFRDDEVEHPRIHLDLAKMSEELSDEEVLLIRLHPHVAGRLCDELAENEGEKIVNVSGYEGVTTLLAVAEVLITDYSSIIFEYCLRNRPMIFYAYDLDRFETEGRSFYRPYREFVPGPVAMDQEALTEAIRHSEGERSIKFVQENFPYLDGKSTERLLELIF